MFLNAEMVVYNKNVFDKYFLFTYECMYVSFVYTPLLKNNQFAFSLDEMNL